MSPLEAQFRRRGVPLDAVGEAAWVPRSFTDPREEHLATRRAAGLFDFSFMGLYEVHGDGAAEFLEAVQSRAARRLAPGELAYTLLLAEDGSVFIDATLWRVDAATWWLFSGRRSDFAWLLARSHGFAVELRDLSGSVAVLALQGPVSARALATLTGEAPLRELGYFRFRDAALGGIPARIARLGYSGELGYELVVPEGASHQAWRLLCEAGVASGLRECGFAAADSLRIESGYVLFGREITGRETPTELGLERLVRGRVAVRAPAQRLAGLEIGSHRQGAAPQLPLARLTSECRSPILGRAIGLGFVSGEAASPGTVVRLADGRMARVARLPFYDPARRLPRASPL